jgi:uncharacterized protein
MQEKDALIQSFIRKSVSLSQDRFRNYFLDERGNPFYKRFAYIRFEKYINDFLNGHSENRFIIVSGLRGTGKTTIVAQICNELQNRGVAQRNLLYISMDEVTGYLGCKLSDIVQGYEQYLTKNFESLKPEDRVFLFVDEAHYDPNWALTLKSVYDKTKSVFILVTGSSAISLSTSTDVARRAKMETLFPLNYLEYNLLQSKIFPQHGLKESIENAVLNSSSANQAFGSINPKLEVVNEYLSKIPPFNLNEYLKFGSLPFAIPMRSEQDVYGRVMAMLEKVVFQDIEAIGKFNRDTQTKIMNLLTLLAISERINYDKLTNTLGMSKPTLSESIETLEKADLLFKIWPFGSETAHIRKTPKYKFMAPAIRTAILWNLGKWEESNDMYGSLLEDTVALYFHRLQRLGRLRMLEFDPDDNCADFIVTSKDGSRIVIEVGYGSKDCTQLHNSMMKCEAKYGLLISDGPLKVLADGRVLGIPKEVFLLS